MSALGVAGMSAIFLAGELQALPPAPDPEAPWRPAKSSGAEVPDLTPPAPPPDAATTRRESVVRTALETTLLVGLGTLWYWRSPSVSDHDLSFDWHTWKSKLTSTDTLAFDDNLFDTNAGAHPRAGTAYYQIARGNGLGFGGSLLSAFLASTVWEYLSEFIERPSINDLIFTPAGGAVIGEATFQVGRYFASDSSGNPMSQLGALLFSPVATINQWTGARSGAGGDAHPRRSWHQFDLMVGAARSVFSDGEGRDEAALGLGDRIVTERAYLRPGAGRVAVSPGAWTEMAARAFLDENRATGLAFHAQTIVWGRYARDYQPPQPGLSSGPQGWGLLAGVGSSFDYETRDLPGFRDRAASVGLLGPTVELDRRRGDVGLRATLTARYGLGMVQSLAYPAFVAEVPAWSTPSVLGEHGYYYAQALLTNARLALAWTKAEVAVSGRLDAYWSIAGRDRFGSQLRDVVALADQRATVGASLAGRPWPVPVRVVTAVERLMRAGQLLDRSITSSETRATVSAAVAF